MAQPIYKFFMFRNVEAFYQLSPAERDALFEKLDAAFKKAGGTRVITCKSGWSSEEWPYFGVEKFPNLEAVQQYTDAMDELNMPRYLVSKTLLGTEWSDE
jgi:hypothetical protein